MALIPLESSVLVDGRVTATVRNSSSLYYGIMQLVYLFDIQKPRLIISPISSIIRATTQPCSLIDVTQRADKYQMHYWLNSSIGVARWVIWSFTVRREHSETTFLWSVFSQYRPRELHKFGSFIFWWGNLLFFLWQTATLLIAIASSVDCFVMRMRQ